MIDTALALIGHIDLQNPLAQTPMGREVNRRVFKDRSSNLRILLYDRDGTVISDSDSIHAVGTVAKAGDVISALQGRYGARWERDQDRGVMLFSTLPLFRNGEIVGAISVIKPTLGVKSSVIRLLRDLAIPAAIALALALAFSYALSAYLTGVIRDLVGRAERISAGDRGVVLATWTKSELGDLARALEVMRQKIEGRAYIEEMASTLSHELKTPLAAIQGAADILEGAKDEATRQRFSESIRAEVSRLTGITNSLLELSRIETAPEAAFVPARLIEVGTEIEKLYISRAEVLGVEFRMECKGDPGSAPMAADSLRRVIVCIMDNAFAFTPRGGSVFLRIAPGNIVVRDNGCGMDAETVAKAFTRFFTSVNPLTGRRGSGLGLAVASSLVERAGGRVSITSSPGEGTEVGVRFPVR